MQGSAKSKDTRTSYNYVDVQGDMWTLTNVKKEELETVGIINGSTYTENMLRKEHGLNMRIKY